MKMRCSTCNKTYGVSVLTKQRPESYECPRCADKRMERSRKRSRRYRKLISKATGVTKPMQEVAK